MALFLVTTAVFGLAFAALAVGVIFTRDKELSGSCGGPGVNPDCCQTCPDRGACESIEGASLEVPPVQARPVSRGLEQAPSASGETGRPVAAPR